MFLSVIVVPELEMSGTGVEIQQGTDGDGEGEAGPSSFLTCKSCFRTA